MQYCVNIIYTGENREREKETENKPEQVSGAGIIGKMHLLLPHFAAVKFVFSKKATKINKIFTVNLTLTT